MLKKIFTKILIVLFVFSLFWFIQNSYTASIENKTQATKEIKNTIQVTEKIPWVNCVKDEWEKLYTCTTKRWFWAIMEMMWEILKYFTFIAWLFAVLSLVVWWIMYSMWWANEGMKTKAKDYIQTSLIWLILLLLSWTILYMIAPWVYV